MRPPEPISVYEKLLRAFGEQGWWPVAPKRGLRPRYRPGFWGELSENERVEICVGAILTQNTAWTNVEKAIAALREEKAIVLRGLDGISSRRLEKLIRSSGYFRQKAKKLKVFARHALSTGKSLKSWLSRPLEQLREELLALWGVGPETADSILLYAGGRESFVVDAYTLRIGARLGWFGARTAYHDARDFFMKSLPASARLYGELHALFVELAKRHCRVRPDCPACPLASVCRHGYKYAH